jgi:hypothetical protein
MAPDVTRVAVNDHRHLLRGFVDFDLDRRSRNIGHDNEPSRKAPAQPTATAGALITIPTTPLIVLEAAPIRRLLLKPRLR